MVLGAFGIDIGDEQIDAIVNGVAAVAAIASVFMSHTNLDDKGDKTVTKT
ncbi:hypothetical protein [Paenibacillus alvei]|nr:hypothetical protein [Paenibacillus alvei]MCY7487472.1 hypothetical protein [Paenibacillus alvei]